MTDPWDILNRAAVELGEVAKAAPGDFWDLEIRGADLSQGGAAWAALLAPAACEPLVDWLLAEARFVRRNHATMHGDVEHLPSLRFARMILGEETS